GAERGAARRLPCGTSRRGICLRRRYCCTPERNRRVGQSHHVPSFGSGRDGPLVSQTGGLAGAVRASSRSERSIARKTYVKLNIGRVESRASRRLTCALRQSQHRVRDGRDDRGGLTLVRHACSDLAFALAQPRLGFLTEFFSFPMPGVAGFVGKQSLRNVEHGHLLAGTTSNAPCSFHCRLYGVAANNRHAWTPCCA